MEWVLAYFGVWVLAIAWMLILGRFKAPLSLEEGGLALLALTGAGLLAAGFVTTELNADIGTLIIPVFAIGAGATLFFSMMIARFIFRIFKFEERDNVKNDTERIYSYLIKKYNNKKDKQLFKVIKLYKKYSKIFVSDEKILTKIIQDIDFMLYFEQNKELYDTEMAFIERALEKISDQRLLARVIRGLKNTSIFDKILKK
ncbi:MAG: hypothetical protein LBU76_10395 [Azoarcus sp.]|jgi:hypothetical protein|nr:hypothetical protein [Azoarcus sp.]